MFEPAKSSRGYAGHPRMSWAPVEPLLDVTPDQVSHDGLRLYGIHYRI
jgi:hypothetical protein